MSAVRSYTEKERFLRLRTLQELRTEVSTVSVQREVSFRA